MKEFWNAIQFIFAAIGGWDTFSEAVMACFMRYLHLWLWTMSQVSCVQLTIKHYRVKLDSGESAGRC